MSPQVRISKEPYYDEKKTTTQKQYTKIYMIINGKNSHKVAKKRYTKTDKETATRTSTQKHTKRATTATIGNRDIKHC